MPGLVGKDVPKTDFKIPLRRKAYWEVDLDAIMVVDPTFPFEGTRNV